MAKNKYIAEILEHLAKSKRTGLKPRKLARSMGISDEEYGSFRQAYKQLRDSGRLLVGTEAAVAIPEHPSTMIGRFHSSPRGFGFVVPEDPDSHADLFVPPDHTGGAMHGDLVRALVQKRGKRQGKINLVGDIVEIIERGTTTIVGTLQRSRNTCFVLPDGKQLNTPVLINNPPPKGKCPEGHKVTAKLIDLPGAETGDLPVAEIQRVLGRAGDLDAEIASTVALFGLPDQFSDETLDGARTVTEGFDPKDTDGRDDLTGELIITIDPETAKDFDDAISLKKDGSRTVLGVHIADVATFIKKESALDQEALVRGTSVYFPTTVVPMLPEDISNGICSLAPDVPRFAVSVYITYDANAKIVEEKVRPSLILSKARLSYKQAQQISEGTLDPSSIGMPAPVGPLLVEMTGLAKRIEQRRVQAGMLHLDLPEIDLTLADDKSVTGATPIKLQFANKMIEMFMVEANEAVARMLTDAGLPFVRRVHPDPKLESLTGLAAFVRACAQKISEAPSREELQQVIRAVSGEKVSYAVNLAILKSLERAYYDIEEQGHYALGSEHYCHFTSPIRRYADLTVHRLVWKHLIHGVKVDKEQSEKTAFDEAKHCTVTSRRAEAAERHLKQSMVLHHLSHRIGQNFKGVITGVADFGVFVQHPEFLVEGLLRLEDLGDDWWEVNSALGQVQGEPSGRTHRLGDELEVQIAAVDISNLKLDLSLLYPGHTKQPAQKPPNQRNQSRGRPKHDIKSKKGPRRKRR